MSLLSYQPFRAVYALLAILINLIKLPFYVVKYIVPSLRPHRTWTFRQSLLNHILRNFLHHRSVLQVRTPLRLAPSVAIKDRLVDIPPSSDSSHYDFISTISPSSAAIRPGTIQGLWCPSVPASPSSSSHPVILHLHGGAYVTGSIDPEFIGNGASLLTTHVSPHVIFSSYRLASSSQPDSSPVHFPAQLQDAITAYAYVLSLGVAAKDVILSGDSAGANLALALLRYLGSAAKSDKPGGLPMPGAALLWSPWLNINHALTPGVVEAHPYAGTDYVSSAFTLWGARTLTMSDSKIATSPFVTFSGNPWRCETPLWVQVGGMEVLREEGESWAREMKGVEGNRVEVWLQEGISHDVLLAGNSNGFEEEGKECARKAGEWVRRLRAENGSGV